MNETTTNEAARRGRDRRRGIARPGQPSQASGETQASKSQAPKAEQIQPGHGKPSKSRQEAPGRAQQPSSDSYSLQSAAERF